ncbi:AP-3 complex subunit sigma [Linum perenne]
MLAISWMRIQFLARIVVLCTSTSQLSTSSLCSIVQKTSLPCLILSKTSMLVVFVETLDKCFRNVCELDIVFNYSKLHTILDEIIFGGQVLETSSAEVMKVVEEISRQESASNSLGLVSKTVSGWRR